MPRTLLMLVLAACTVPAQTLSRNAEAFHASLGFETKLQAGMSLGFPHELQ